MSKTFGQAFSEARKQGLDKFQWNGNWYTTKTKEESEVKGAVVTNEGRNANDTYVKGSSTMKNGKAQISVQQGKRYQITKMNGDQFAIYDNEDEAYLSTGKGAFKSYKEAEAYLNSDDFKNSLNVQITAPRTRVDRNTSGYIPVDSRTDLVDKKGNTRTYQNYKTGEIFVTDNYGNIIGQSYDEAAKQNGWMGFNVYTGSKDDLTRSELGRKRQEYTTNEVNQLAKQKELRQRAGEEGLIKDIQKGRENFAKGTANFVSNSTNLPNHAVLGLARTLGDNYTIEDYLKGFNVANFTGNVDQTIGLGDVMDVENPYLRAGLNFANVYSMPRGVKLPSSQINPGAPKMLNMQVSTQPGSVYKYTKTVFPAKGWGNQASAGKTWINAPMPTAPTMTTTPGSITPGSVYNTGFFDIEQKQPQAVEQVPTEVFEYQNGPVNRTVMGRIATGDFVPGTTSPNWDGTIYGGSSGMYNTNGHYFSGFGGVTAGPAQDNTTDKYASDSTPSKPKLISKKKKDDSK